MEVHFYVHHHNQSHYHKSHRQKNHHCQPIQAFQNPSKCSPIFNFFIVYHKFEFHIPKLPLLSLSIFSKLLAFPKKVQ